MIPFKLPLAADRGLVFNEQIAFFGANFTGATYRFQIRIVPDAGGSALVSLTTTVSTSAAGVRLIYSGSATLNAHVAASRITQAQADTAAEANGYDPAVDSVPLSVLNIRILAATTLGLPYPETINEGERGEDVSLAHDLLVTISGGDEAKYLYGPFKVRGTVTQ